VHQDARDEDEIASRNLELANTAEALMRTIAQSLPDFFLVPRLIGRDIYHHPLPPDSLEAVLRADLRFMVGTHSFYLAERVVNALERENEVPPDPWGKPQPPGNRHRARSEERRREWGEYLFDRGMEHLWQGWDFAATAYYQEALRCDPGHADAWVHLGNRCFEEDRVTEALDYYKRGQEAAQARTVGDPAHYPYPFWLDVDSRPFMRALHGQGLCLWRLDQVEKARQIYAWMLELNPNDNQGARFVLRDIDAGLSWEESAALDEEQNTSGAT
jgi:tetratricopeptide (TPR) repeat protein